MAGAKKQTTAARAKSAPKKNGPAPRARLIRDLEDQWCALSSAMALFQTRSAALRGLTLSDLQAVDILAREDAVCASELAEECGLTKGAITGMLNRLERAGVARRSRDEGDARRLVIRAVTDPHGCDCRVPRAFREVAETFGEEDLRRIRQFLSESARALRLEAESLQSEE